MNLNASIELKHVVLALSGLVLSTSLSIVALVSNKQPQQPDYAAVIEDLQVKAEVSEQRIMKSNLERPRYDEVEDLIDERIAAIPKPAPVVHQTIRPPTPVPTRVEPPKPAANVQQCDRQKNRLHWELFGEPAPGCDL